MLSEERRREILEMLRINGRVLVRHLSKRFRTSLITVRKDLESLHHQGLLERTHGGALPVRTGALQDQTLQEKERAQMMRRALEQLPAEQRELLRLRYGQELRLTQIATLLEKPEGSVRKMLSRILRRLRTLYEQEEKRTPHA